jgi:hypothetical protein
MSAATVAAAARSLDFMNGTLTGETNGCSLSVLRHR